MPIVGIGAVILTGASLAWLLSVHPTSRPVEFAGLLILLGLGVVSLEIFGLGLLAPPAIARWIIVGLAVLAGLVAAWATLKRRVASPGAVELWSLVLLAPVLLQIGFVGFIALHRDLGWDGLFVWEMKARAVCLASGAVPAELFRDPELVVFQPHYPLLLPLSEAWLDIWLGACSESAAHVLPVALYFGGVLLVAGGVWRVSGSKIAAIGASILPLAVPALTVGDGSASSGYADVGLAAFYAGAALYAVDFVRNRNRRPLVLSALLACLGVWIKQEGIIYLGFLLAFLVASGSISLKNFAVFATPGAILWTVWRAFLASQGTTLGFDFLPLSVANLLDHLDRLPVLALMLARELANTDHWGLFWLAVCATLLLDRRAAGSAAVAVLVCGPILFWTLAYVLTAWTPYTEHVRTSLPRLVLQPVLCAVMLLALRIAPATSAHSDANGSSPAEIARSGASGAQLDAGRTRAVPTFS